jgi:hypothetical protein
LIDDTPYAPNDNVTLTFPPQFVECVSDANPAVNCTVEFVTLEEASAINSCLLQLSGAACTNFYCSFKCTVSNSVNPTGIRAEVSFNVV